MPVTDDVQLGRPIEGDPDRPRYAIHMAVAAVVPVTDLAPGTHVRIVPGTGNRIEANEAEAIGIVDPFLPHPARADRACWMLLYPNTITGLRHAWSHPSFEDEP